jgi:hypothetical protein
MCAIGWPRKFAGPEGLAGGGGDLTRKVKAAQQRAAAGAVCARNQQSDAIRVRDG